MSVRTHDRRQYTVRKLKIGRSEQMDALARAAGELYSQVVVWFWRTVRHKDLWLRAKHMMRWLTSALLHAHSSDAIVQAFFAALDSWRARRATDPAPTRLPGMRASLQAHRAPVSLPQRAVLVRVSP